MDSKEKTPTNTNNMISKETAAKIWGCYDQIEKAKGLITSMKKALEESGAPDIPNAFGERRGLQLGVPSGNSGHTIFNVSPELSIQVIESHIESHESKLNELRAIALIELKG